MALSQGFQGLMFWELVYQSLLLVVSWNHAEVAERITLSAAHAPSDPGWFVPLEGQVGIQTPISWLNTYLLQPTEIYKKILIIFVTTN